jgi:glycine/D-amino acid oxidase-like deaminating enzyme
MSEPDVVVIGGGQAGLSVSHELSAAGVDHVVLERGRIGETWRGRWDTFCLVTPNWTVRLPGGAYAGNDPDGFLPRDAIVAHLESYAQSFKAPVRERVAVTALHPIDGGFAITTSEGELRPKTVVLATGAYQKAHRPAAAASLPRGLYVVDAESYRNAEALPPGKVLIVGSGQTGCQIAEELHEAGRDVFLACGRAPWISRRLGGRDFVAWLFETPFFDLALGDLPSPEARLISNVQATGHGGGHDLHYRTLQRLGVNLVGHFIGADTTRFRFANDLAESVAFGDARYADISLLIRKTCESRSMTPPDLPPPRPFDAATPRPSVDLAGFGAVIFTSGFRPDYRSWIHAADAFDDFGFPITQDGRSTAVPGLYFCGVHFLRKRKSSLLMGVGEDAAIVARSIARVAPEMTA